MGPHERSQFLFSKYSKNWLISGRQCALRPAIVYFLLRAEAATGTGNEQSGELLRVRSMRNHLLESAEHGTR